MFPLLLSNLGFYIFECYSKTCHHCQQLSSYQEVWDRVLCYVGKGWSSPLQRKWVPVIHYILLDTYISVCAPKVSLVFSILFSTYGFHWSALLSFVSLCFSVWNSCIGIVLERFLFGFVYGSIKMLIILIRMEFHKNLFSINRIDIMKIVWVCKLS